MPGVTFIFSAFERNFVLSLGGEIQKEEDHEKEVVVVESQGRVSQPVGFSRNQDDDWEEDDDDEDARSKPLRHGVVV